MPAVRYYEIMNISDFIIILCRASESGNVGAVCRAMKNMGLSRLRMVSQGNLNEDVLLARAVHAGDVWQNACFYDSLPEATADCSLVIGTTHRRGRKRKYITMEPRILVKWLAARTGQQNQSSNIALVFGNERTGLDDNEINLCNIASHIPVSDDFPSLNLSHAVQIYAYELYLAFGGSVPVKGEWNAMDSTQAEKLTGEITGTLAELGFYKKPGRELQTRFLRDLISRAGLTEKEGRYFRNIISKAAHLPAENT